MTKVVKNLTIINILIFIISYLLEKSGFNFINTFALFPLSSDLYQNHQWISYQFLHGSISHIILNMIALLSFGPVVENHLKGNFIWFYLICGFGSAFLQLMFFPEIALIGASGAIFGVLLLYVILEPNSKILLFFIIPIKAKWLMSMILVFESYMTFFGEPDGVAHLAHIGGAMTGFIWFIITKKMK